MAHVTIQCPGCKEYFLVPYKERKRKFCSHKCRAKVYLTPEHNAKVARESASKRGDAQRGSGEGKSYIKENGQHQHVTVMERMLGRKLLPKEIVHHIDGDRRNNNPSNLELLRNQSQHASEHIKDRLRDSQGRLR